MTDESPSGGLPARNAANAQHALPPALIHDLRTPLGHVLGYAELLKEQVNEGGHSELLPYIDKIHIAADQLLDLINTHFQSNRETEP